jgi:hypothetical protein
MWGNLKNVKKKDEEGDKFKILQGYGGPSGSETWALKRDWNIIQAVEIKCPRTVGHIS